MPAELTPDIAAGVHPDRLANEQTWWAARDHLLAKYAGQWVAFAGGRFVASDRSPVGGLAQGEVTDPRPHSTCVGREREPDRARRASFFSGPPAAR